MALGLRSWPSPRPEVQLPTMKGLLLALLMLLFSAFVLAQASAFAERDEALKGLSAPDPAQRAELFAGLPLKLPVRLQDRESAWHLYAIELGDQVGAPREEVFAGMREAGIGVNVHYIPIHTQPHYRRLGFARGDFPNAERYYARAISLPLFPAMTEEQQDTVAETVIRLIA